MSKNEARHDTDTFRTLSKYFDAQEIVELTTVAAFRGLMNRFMDSLQIELEGPEVQARGGRAGGRFTTGRDRRGTATVIASH